MAVKDRVQKRVSGEDVTFTVKISGTPKPDIQWYINEYLITPSHKFITSRDDENANLTIKKLEPEDENHYTVKVKNDHGEVEESVSLLVISTSN